MPRILIVFRGENKRWNNGSFHDVRRCIPNNKVRIIDSIRKMGYEADVIFCTYDSEYLHSYVEAYNPKHVFKMDYAGSSQHKNFKFVLDCVDTMYKEYDRIIILRFDLLFKKNISEWDTWTKSAIMFPWKDNNATEYEERKYCQEVIIAIPCELFKEFKDLYNATYEKWKDITWGLHFLTTELFKYEKIPYYFMEGDKCWISNTSLNHPDSKNPYLINSIYKYYMDDYYLADV